MAIIKNYILNGNTGTYNDVKKTFVPNTVTQTQTVDLQPINDALLLKADKSVVDAINLVIPTKAKQTDLDTLKTKVDALPKNVNVISSTWDLPTHTLTLTLSDASTIVQVITETPVSTIDNVLNNTSSKAVENKVIKAKNDLQDTEISKKENIINKATDLTLVNDIKYPTTKAIKIELDKKKNLADLVTVIRDTATVTDVNYPSEKAVRTLFDSLKITGIYKGSASTLALLPVGVNGDWAILNTLDGANKAGIYVTDGTTYSLDMEIQSFLVLTDAQLQDIADVTVGTIKGGKALYDREQALKGTISQAVTGVEEIAKSWDAKTLNIATQNIINAYKFWNKDVGSYGDGSITINRPDERIVISPIDLKLYKAKVDKVGLNKEPSVNLTEWELIETNRLRGNPVNDIITLKSLNAKEFELRLVKANKKEYVFKKTASLTTSELNDIDNIDDNAGTGKWVHSIKTSVIGKFSELLFQYPPNDYFPFDTNPKYYDTGFDSVNASEVIITFRGQNSNETQASLTLNIEDKTQASNIFYGRQYGYDVVGSIINWSPFTFSLRSPDNHRGILLDAKFYKQTELSTTLDPNNMTVSNPNEADTLKVLKPNGDGTATFKSLPKPKAILDYSTTEQDTGRKWIDGKPIYQKTYNKSIPNNGGNLILGSGLDRLIRIEGNILNASGSLQKPISMGVDNDGTITAYFNSGSVIVSQTWNSNGVTHIEATIFYTKK